MTQAEKTLQQSHHQTAAASHTELASCMKALADDHTSMAARTQMTDRAASAMHSQACEHCTKAAEAHAALAADHLRMHKSIGEMPEEAGGPAQKLLQGSEREAALTDIILKLAGGSPVPFGISAIPRFGAPDPKATTVSKLDTSLQRLVHDDTQAAT
jgi:hypothetical protein